MTSPPPPLRNREPSELLDAMHAHKGACTHCKGPVKMVLHPATYEPMPSNCICLFCGQRYYMEIADIDAWELEQWRQKDAL